MDERWSERNLATSNSVSFMKKEFVGAALESPFFYQPPPLDGVRQPNLPCLCFSVIGTAGDGKSTFTNAFCSAIAGTPVVPCRAGAGNEKTAGTTRCTLIPLHEYIWPRCTSPPAYIFIWETVGLSDNDITSTSTAKSLLMPMISGTVAPVATSVNAQQDLTKGNAHIFPKPQFIFVVRNHAHLATKGQNP